MLKNLVTAIRTLTIIPTLGKDTEHFPSSLPWFPFVGLILAGILFGISCIIESITGMEWHEGTAFIVVASGVVLTGGIHLDGFADWADSLGCSPDKKRMFAVMKDPRMGAFGVMAVLINLLGKWVALAAMARYDLMVWLIGAYVVSRFAVVDLTVWLPYARSEGGTGENFVQDARQKHRLYALFSSLIFLFLFLGAAGIAALGIGWILGRIFGLWCRRRLGGITGDLMGACSEIVEMFLLLLCAAFGKYIIHWTGWEMMP